MKQSYFPSMYFQPSTPHHYHHQHLSVKSQSSQSENHKMNLYSQKAKEYAQKAQCIFTVCNLYNLKIKKCITVRKQSLQPENKQNASSWSENDKMHLHMQSDNSNAFFNQRTTKCHFYNQKTARFNL